MENAMTDASEGLHVDERRLAAILAADVAGYSRLMGGNEDATVRDLEVHKAVLLPLIAKHGGSIINIAGDGIVAQFPSAVRAVECAVAMQKIMGERNVDVPKDRQMLLRIGVNLGDIIHDADKTYGDGINVAARLEPLAEPGGICISATVREAIFGKLGLPMRDVGEKSLKNIARPVHVYEIQPPGTRARRDWLGRASAPISPPRARARARRAARCARRLSAPGASGRVRAVTHAEYTPVMAVLPFTNTSGDASLDSLGPSLAREVSSMLSTYPKFRMVEPSGLPPQGAQDIGRRYTLDGDLMKGGDRLRVRARLTDAASGETVWSDTYEFANEDALASQKKTAERVYGALAGNAGRLLNIEEEVSWRKPELRLDRVRLLSPFDDVHNEVHARQRAARAKDRGGQDLERFPNSANLKIRLAYSYLLESLAFGPFENCRETIDIAFKLGREAEEAKNKSRFEIYQTRRLMAHAYAWHGEEFDRAIDDAEATLEMAPTTRLIGRSSRSIWLTPASSIRPWTGSNGRLRTTIRTFSRRGPTPPWTYYLAGRYEDALQVLKGVEATHPWRTWSSMSV